MIGVLFAERAVLAENESVRIVLLVLNCVIVSMLAFCAFKSDFSSCRLGCHNQNSIQKNYTPRSGAYIEFSIFKIACQSFLQYFLYFFVIFLFFSLFSFLYIIFVRARTHAYSLFFYVCKQSNKCFYKSTYPCVSLVVSIN